MDNAWQTKCSSAWASSSQMPQQESRSQMERSMGQYFHPSVTQQIGTMGSGIGREQAVFNPLNSGWCKSGKPELRNSFLALLSGSSSQVQWENAQLSNSTSGKLPMLDNSHILRSDNCGVPLAPVGLLSQHQENENVANGAEQHPVNPSREASTHIGNYVSVFRDNHQTENLNRHSSDIAKPDYHHAIQGTEPGTSPSASRWGWLASSKPPTLGHCNAKNVQASVKVPSDIKSLVSDRSSASISGHPFVFCLATKGELLLSNTGLLGVLCSCHGLHMSIRKFCEHSGLCAVNPGEAVRLESGETIAQWRRLYFLKSRIRIPDDNSGWEWPERIPATVGLVKCKTTGLNMSKNSDMFQMVDPFVGLARSGQSCNNLASQKLSQTGQSVLEKTFNNVMPQQRNTPEGCSVIHRSLIGNTQNTLPSPSDIQTRQIIKENPNSGGLPPSKSPLEKGQEDNAYQAISDYINFLTKGGGAFISNQNLGIFKFLGSDSNVHRSNSSREAFIMDRDAIPSNIELRLGQPSQQSRTLEGSVVSAVPSQQYDALHDCEKSLSQASIFHDSNSRLAGESRQNLWYAPSDNNRRQNLIHLIPGSSNSVDAAKLEQLNGDTAKSSLVSMFLSHLNTPSLREVQPHADINTINGEPVMLRVPHCKSHISHDLSDFPKNKSDERQGHININRLGPLNKTDRDQGLHSADNCSYPTEKANPLFHNKHMAGLNPFTGVGGNLLLNSLNVNENHSPYLCQPSGILQDPSDIGNLPNQFGKGYCPGGNSHLDHALLRSMHCSTVADGSRLPISAVSTGFSSTTSICRQNLTPPLANKDGDKSPHMVDENLRLLALRRMLDFSKQEHAGAFYEMELGQERAYSLSAMEMQRQGSTFCPPSSSEEIKDETHFITKQDASEVSVKHHLACSSRFIDGGMEKLADVTGVNNWCNLSTSSQPISLRSMEPVIQHPPSFGPICNKQPMLRFGRIEANKCTISDHEAYNQTELNPNLPLRYSCAFQSGSLSESCACGGKAPIDGCKGNIGRSNSTAPTLVPSMFDNVHMNLEDKANAIDRYDNLWRQSSTQNDCQASQWRDVPSKQKGCCDAPCIERSAGIFNGRRNAEDQPIETAAVVINEIQEAESLNEQQMSNGFSGCSAPAVTEITGEVNNVGSCTVDAKDARYINDHVFDEGSGIAKCWSSDETFDSERSTETINGSGKLHDMAKRGFSSGGLDLSSEGPIDDLRLGNIRLKKLPNRSPAYCTVYKSINCNRQLESDLKVGKRKKPTKWKRLDASFPASGLSLVHYDSPKSQVQDEIHLSSSCSKKISSRPNHGLQIMCGISSNGHSNFKRKRSALNSVKTLSKKRDRRGLHDHHGDWEDYSRKKLEAEMHCSRKSKLLGEKRLKWCCNTDANRHFPRRETNRVSAGKAVKDDSASSVQHSNFSINQIGTCDRQPRPVVCGNFGIISNGKLTEGQTKPTKIISLSLILKKARRCDVSENAEPIPSSISETKKSCFRSEYNNTIFESDMDSETLLFEKKKEGFSRNEEVCLAELSMPQKDRDGGRPRSLKQDILTRFSSAPLKSKFKETRKRSLDELSGKGNKLSPIKFCLEKSLKCSFQTKHRFHGQSCLLKGTDDSQCHTGELCEGITKKSIKDRKCQAFVVDSDAFCCVCGSSNKDEFNCLLECSSCSVRVHQACYGVSKAPKGRWYCRPCRANSKNIVCVLCGYGGGAMTRALKSRNIVNSFLKVWDITEHSSLAVLKKNWHKQTYAMKSSSGLTINSEVHNSITAGALDATIKQWVHMVCGLWTPGTRCPNVDTMSAFDVSGASRPPKDVVCSMCNQFGGSYIQCRVLNCTVHFHPWCAHQKGLLQSEVEGVDNEKVGFYGRCLLHVTHSECDSDSDPVDTEFDVKKEEFSCARAQGYKGRRKDGCRHFHYGRSNSNGCLVPQEQINAWLHINGQKSSARGLLKPVSSDIEYDCRKEYARYKQVKRWKHLVVYKSGIHALGLYTSQYIPRGAMVVEYVGEIVGLRVADKREIEYQSGRKLLYKSACYFFRIDKEHIIDATRKGGIARFVNHSCLPNCVAKVISVRNEKKVVFFAERDINPGEEITYDYHFNHEDEGKKIPCFCNSKNCRRYLN